MTRGFRLLLATVLSLGLVVPAAPALAAGVTLQAADAAQTYGETVVVSAALKDVRVFDLATVTGSVQPVHEGTVTMTLYRGADVAAQPPIARTETIAASR